MRKSKKIRKSKTDEIQYIGAMLTATTIQDGKRLQTIQKRLAELSK